MSATTVSQFFDHYALDFNAIYGTRNTPWNQLINRWLRRSMRLRFDKTLEACEPVQGKSVLDIGCGPGHYSAALAAQGAARVLGIDFAPTMIALSRQRAREQGVDSRCEFQVVDFLKLEIAAPFDFAVLMGFMDYVSRPLPLVQKVFQVTREMALFSFPAAGGFLAWQRGLRYRSRCDLYFYTRPQIEDLFARAGAEQVVIERIARDYFVSARPPGWNART